MMQNQEKRRGWEKSTGKNEMVIASQARWTFKTLNYPKKEKPGM